MNKNKRIRIPDGVYMTAKDYAKHHNLNERTIQWQCANDKFEGFYIKAGKQYLIQL